MHAHAHPHVGTHGFDVDIDVDRASMITIGVAAAVLLGLGVVAAFQDGGGAGGGAGTAGTDSVPVTRTLTPSEQLGAAEARLESIRQLGASPALTAATVSEVLSAGTIVAAQERDTALEIDRMLARPR